MHKKKIIKCDIQFDIEKNNYASAYKNSKDDLSQYYYKLHPLLIQKS